MRARLPDCGGIDLQLLGIGKNGHIGFNEPSSSLGSRTRKVRLSQDTISANRRFFSPRDLQPEWALTMGIQTILEARDILMLAFGENKATAVAAMTEGPLGAMRPASALQDYYRSAYPVAELLP
jgi:glucosamine-6-phosphate deaminase